MNTETEIDRMKRIPIEDFLARLGHHPVQRRANAVWYRSPYREEKTPSFKVNPEKNLWYDFGEGKGGNIFALAGEFIRTDDFLAQVKYVAEMSGMPLPEHEPRQSPGVRQAGGQSFEDVEILPLQNRALLHYLQERGIPSAIAIANCKEMRYTTASGILPLLSATEAADMRYATRSSRGVCRRRMSPCCRPVRPSATCMRASWTICPPVRWVSGTGKTTSCSTRCPTRRRRSGIWTAMGG